MSEMIRIWKLRSRYNAANLFPVRRHFVQPYLYHIGCCMHIHIAGRGCLCGTPFTVVGVVGAREVLLSRARRLRPVLIVTDSVVKGRLVGCPRTCTPPRNPARIPCGGIIRRRLVGGPYALSRRIAKQKRRAHGGGRARWKHRRGPLLPRWAQCQRLGRHPAVAGPDGHIGPWGAVVDAVIMPMNLTGSALASGASNEMTSGPLATPGAGPRRSSSPHRGRWRGSSPCGLGRHRTFT